MGPAWRNVLLLALVSLIADVSGEMLMAILPFVLVAQGATGVGLGLVAGVSEGIGHAMKLAGGYLGQRGRRLPLVAGGYLLAALSRFGVAYAPTWPITLGFRSLDRVGKGLRTAPRDAILADSAPRSMWGRAFGLHRAADTTGAVVGVLAVLAFLAWLGPGEDTERTIILVGAIVGVLTLAPLLFVKEPEAETPEPAGKPLTIRPPPRYLAFLAVVALANLARLSYLFFLLRAAAGSSVTAAVGWYLAFNVVYAAASYPLGLWADKVGHGPVFLIGLVLTGAASACFVPEPTAGWMAAGFVVLGLSYAALEGSGRALASDLSEKGQRSGRLGEYHAVAGAATLAGGLAAGLLWDHAGEAAAFAWGAVLAFVAVGVFAALAMVRPKSLLAS